MTEFGSELAAVAVAEMAAVADITLVAELVADGCCIGCCCGGLIGCCCRG